MYFLTVPRSPDMTYAVDWALKANYLSTVPIIISKVINIDLRPLL